MLFFYLWQVPIPCRFCAAVLLKWLGRKRSDILYILLKKWRRFIVFVELIS